MYSRRREKSSPASTGMRWCPFGPDFSPSQPPPKRQHPALRAPNLGNVTNPRSSSCFSYLNHQQYSDVCTSTSFISLYTTQLLYNISNHVSEVRVDGHLAGQCWCFGQENGCQRVSDSPTSFNIDTELGATLRRIGVLHV